MRTSKARDGWQGAVDRYLSDPAPRVAAPGAGRARLVHVVVAAAALGLLVAPLAMGAGEGDPILGGQRNPDANRSAALTAETQIIAESETYSTRQSNKMTGDGGAAIYGCRSVAGKEPCLRAANLSTGRALELRTGGNEGARIVLGDKTGAPLTTNAEGVATGLNADKVDGKDAGAFLEASAKAADADKLDGADSGSFLSKAEALFAVVNADASYARSRGTDGTATLTAPATYTVPFNRDVSACTYQATARTAGVNATAVLNPGNARAVDVSTDTAGAAAAAGFHLLVLC